MRFTDNSKVAKIQNKIEKLQSDIEKYQILEISLRSKMDTLTEQIVDIDNLKAQQLMQVDEATQFDYQQINVKNSKLIIEIEKYQYKISENAKEIRIAQQAVKGLQRLKAIEILNIIPSTIKNDYPDFIRVIKTTIKTLKELSKTDEKIERDISNNQYYLQHHPEREKMINLLGVEKFESLENAVQSEFNSQYNYRMDGYYKNCSDEIEKILKIYEELLRQAETSINQTSNYIENLIRSSE